MVGSMKKCPECGKEMEKMDEQKFCCEDCGCFVHHQGNSFTVERPS